MKCKHEVEKVNVSIGPLVVICTCRCGVFHIGQRYGFDLEKPIERFPQWANQAYLSAIRTLSGMEQ